MASGENASTPSGWFGRQWRDIRGNFKWAVVRIVGGALVTGAIAVTHGLLLWQQVVLAACFIALFGWAVVATVRPRPTAPAALADATKFPPTPFDPSVHTGEEFPVLRKLAIRDETRGRDYPSKVYVEMLNNTAGCAEVMTSRWFSGIKAELLQDVLQLWLGFTWFPVPHGISRLHVPPGERFRLWIAPDEQYGRDELQRLCDAKNFGTVMIRVNGKERGIIL